ncbi:CENPB DNA-binding domain-containing protein 1 [Portunus trituberculatus]|uniref:CENPB DNA-binding domain-containing protein 1 n=1 Tax=Portunus trituberculatus TaxID=210409 RepID=A0A5B7EEM4_PORTR|nr:CENPB DNA-binding domain-containing protein 1 [Portunus trituberculatus]
MLPKRPATSPTMSPSVAKTRKSLTHEVKLDIIHRYERGEKTNSIAHHRGLTPSTVSTIFKSADSIKKAAQNKVTSKHLSTPSQSRQVNSKRGAHSPEKLALMTEAKSCVGAAGAEVVGGGRMAVGGAGARRG